MNGTFQALVLVGLAVLIAVVIAVLCRNESRNTMEFAQSQIEWMSESIGKQFNSSRDNPFDLKYFELQNSCFTQSCLFQIAALSDQLGRAG